MDPPDYNRIQSNIIHLSHQLDLTDFLTNVYYKQQYFLNYKTVSSFDNIPQSDDKVTIYDYGSLLEVDLYKFPHLLIYVIGAITERTPSDWCIRVNDKGHIYYQNNSIAETLLMHPMTSYYTNMIKQKKKSFKKKKRCSIM
jgi:hypothetical protein